MKPGLSDLKNAIVVPHIASASKVKSGGFCSVFNVSKIQNLSYQASS